MADPSQSQADLIRKGLGLSDAVPDSDIEELMKSPAGEAILHHVQGQGQKGLVGDVEGFVQSGVQGLENYKGTKEIESEFDKIGEGKKAAPAKKKAAKSTGISPEQQALQDIQTYLTSQVSQGEEAMGIEGQQLASQNEAVTMGIGQMLGGGGVSSGNAAVDAASAAYENAYKTGEGFNAAAYANMGAANAAYVASSPEQGIINLLTQNVGSSQYKELSPGQVSSLPPSVRDALAAAGITEQVPGQTGGTPITAGTGSTNNLAKYLAQIQNTGAIGAANPQSGITGTNPNASNVTG